MTFHLSTLHFLSFAMLAASAGVLTSYGRTRQPYRGHWGWVTAQWLLATGHLVMAFREPLPAVLPLANLLILQSPVVMLAGMRRFHARHEWRVPAATDWLLLAASFIVWLATWASQDSGASSTVIFAIGAAAGQFYSAVLLAKLPEYRRSSALRVLAASATCTACAQLLHIAPTLPGPWNRVTDDMASTAVCAVTLLSSLAMVYAVLLLSSERTETNLRAALNKMRFLADMDALTRVPNRRHFHELAAKTMAADTAGGGAMMMFDIDHFKTINDSFGHAVGDNALRHVGRCIREALRDVDVPGRLGGDEFAVLLPGAGVDDAMSVATRIVRQLELRRGSLEFAQLSLSFGVVQMQPDESIADALRRADQALYEAKRQGRSRAVAASGEEDRPVFSESRRLGLDSA